jgi:hypothetical protein
LPISASEVGARWFVPVMPGVSFGLLELPDPVPNDHEPDRLGLIYARGFHDHETGPLRIHVEPIEVCFGPVDGSSVEELPGRTEFDAR